MSDYESPDIYFCHDTNQFVGLTEDIKQQLIRLYPEINVPREVGKMRIWLCSSKGSKRKGRINFITNWLKRVAKNETMKNFDSSKIFGPIAKEIKCYLKDLWKNREFILDHNTKKN